MQSIHTRHALVILLILSSLSSLAQIPTLEADLYRQQRRQTFLYNLAVGASIGGIGALINKRPEQPWWEALYRGASQGLMGGFVNHQAKNLAYQIAKHENYGYGWAARLTQSMATSVIENAASNRPFWASYHFAFGPVRLLVDARNGYRPTLRVAPGALVGNIWIATKGKFSWSRTIRSGAPVYVSEGPVEMFGDSYAGFVISNATVIQAQYLGDYELFAHEYIHILQYEDYLGTNAFWNKPYQRWTENTAFFRQTDRFVYYDFHMPIRSAVVLSIRDRVDRYFQNWFEFEAEHFATKDYVFR